MSETKTATLKVPGASLYYEVTGSGPVLLMISGAPADAGAFAAIAAQLADRYTVVTYDWRGDAGPGRRRRLSARDPRRWAGVRAGLQRRGADRARPGHPPSRPGGHAGRARAAGHEPAARRRGMAGSVPGGVCDLP